MGIAIHFASPRRPPQGDSGSRGSRTVVLIFWQVINKSYLCENVCLISMKHLNCVIITIFISILASSSLCNAQKIYIGGGIGIGASGNGLSVNISPDIAYRVSNSFVVGGQLSYRTGYNRFAVIPYARWHIMPMEGPVSVFLSATAPCEFAHNYTSAGLRFRPGLSVRASDNLYLYAHIGSFGYSTVWSSGTRSGSWVAQLDSNSISLGFCIVL